MSKFINSLYKNKFLLILPFLLILSLVVIDSFEEAYFLGILTLAILFISSLIGFIFRKCLSYKLLLMIFLILISIISTSSYYALNLLAVKFENLELLVFITILNSYIIMANLLINADLISYGKKLVEVLSIAVIYLILLVIFGLFYEILVFNQLTIIFNLSPIFGSTLKIANIIFENNLFPNHIFESLGGIFIISGFILALLNFKIERKGDNDEYIDDIID